MKAFDVLGCKVKDKVRGFEGVASSVSFDMVGCVQAYVLPPAKDGAMPDGQWFDIARLEVGDRVMPQLFSVPVQQEHEQGSICKSAPIAG